MAGRNSAARSITGEPQEGIFPSDSKGAEQILAQIGDACLFLYLPLSYLQESLHLLYICIYVPVC